MLTTMLSSPEGIRYLTEDKLISQMASCFSDVDEVRTRRHRAWLLLTIQQAGRRSSRPVFTKDRIERTLTHGYFEMLGTMTKNREGLLCVSRTHYKGTSLTVLGLSKSTASSRQSTTSQNSQLSSKSSAMLSRASTTLCTFILGSNDIWAQLTRQ
jgi:rapamycin-insensitive companion of mTOR